MLFSLLFALLTGTITASAPTGQTIERRGPQTSAICSSDFLWMDNSQGISPCFLAAVILGACHGDSWNVPALVKPTDMYTNPNSSTANVCTCSWLAYNLLAACAVCQGFMQAVPNVAPYFESCQGFTTTTGSDFPTNYSLPEDTFIPYWATRDPSTWPSQHFDVKTAKNVSQQGYPDIGHTTICCSTKKTPIGAIVGGLIGGLALTVLAVGIAFLSYKRRNAPRQLASPSVTMEHSTHIRTPSDVAMAFLGSHSYATLPQEYVIEPFTSPPISLPRESRKNTTRSTHVNNERTTLLISTPSCERRGPPSNPPNYSDTDLVSSSGPRVQRPDTYQTHTSGLQNGSEVADEGSVSPFGYVSRIHEVSATVAGRFVGGLSRDVTSEERQ